MIQSHMVSLVLKNGRNNLDRNENLIAQKRAKRNNPDIYFMTRDHTCISHQDYYPLQHLSNTCLVCILILLRQIGRL